MKSITSVEASRVSGGNPALAIAEGTAIFIAIPEIGSALGLDWSYPTIGSNLGESIFDITHPNPLGQMIYYPSDFGYSYIPSAFPGEFPHW